MSENQFLLTVVTPDKCLFKDKPVVAVGAFGSLGAFTALPGHEPFLTDLKPAEAWWRDRDGQSAEFFVSGGFIEVLPDRVTILADSAEMKDEIDEERARRSEEKRQRQLKQAKTNYAAKQAEAEAAKGNLTAAELEAIKKERIEIFKAEAALARATARVKAAANKTKIPRKPK